MKGITRRRTRIKQSGRFRFMALLLGEWVNEARETAFLGDRGVNSAFYGVWKSGLMAGCKHTDTYGTSTASPASGQLQRSRASSVTRRPASSTCAGGGKNGMRSVRASHLVLGRPHDTPRARPALRGHAGLPEGGDSSRRVQDVRQGEAGNLGLAGGQSGLHHTLRLLRGTALPDHDDQGCRRGTPARFGRRPKTSRRSICASGCVERAGLLRRWSGSTRSRSARGTPPPNPEIEIPPCSLSRLSA